MIDTRHGDHGADPHKHDEARVGMCLAFVGAVWGTLIGGLMTSDPAIQAAVAAGSVGAAGVGFAVRETWLARSWLKTSGAAHHTP